MYKNDAAATYLHEHSACTVCGRPAAFVTASRPFSTFCYGCAPTYLHHGGRALVEVVRFDSDSAAAGSVEHKQHSKGDGNMDAQNELDNAQKTLRKYEAELYRGKAAAEEAARTDEAETTEEAMARLLDAEAHMYERDA